MAHVDLKEFSNASVMAQFPGTDEPIRIMRGHTVRLKNSREEAWSTNMILGFSDKPGTKWGEVQVALSRPHAILVDGVMEPDVFIREERYTVSLSSLVENFDFLNLKNTRFNPLCLRVSSLDDMGNVEN